MDEAMFVRAITAAPGDDTPRLVYADWLDDHDNSLAADYLRTELELAKLPPEASDASRLRGRLWRVWAGVRPEWLWQFTQPRVLRTQPTPFPVAWRNFGLGRLREARGTYGSWPYDSLPELSAEDFREAFPAFDAEHPSAPSTSTPGHALDLAPVHAAAKEYGVSLPGDFVRFMSDPGLHGRIRSVTDCFFTLPDTSPDEYSPVRPGPLGDGIHVTFYQDSQTCLLWDLYLHPSGAHCVIARWPDYFEPEPPDPETTTPPYTGPRAWFVAPSFRAFTYRMWVENEVWYHEHADFLRGRGDEPPLMSAPARAYIDHYRRSSGGG